MQNTWVVTVFQFWKFHASNQKDVCERNEDRRENVLLEKSSSCCISENVIKYLKKKKTIESMSSQQFSIYSDM